MGFSQMIAFTGSRRARSIYSLSIGGWFGLALIDRRGVHRIVRNTIRIS
jgi:hypothetical protein